MVVSQVEVKGCCCLARTVMDSDGLSLGALQLLVLLVVVGSSVAGGCAGVLSTASYCHQPWFDGLWWPVLPS